MPFQILFGLLLSITLCLTKLILVYADGSVDSVDVFFFFNFRLRDVRAAVPRAEDCGVCVCVKSWAPLYLGGLKIQNTLVREG